jgi:hypothetical protein
MFGAEDEQSTLQMEVGEWGAATHPKKVWHYVSKKCGHRHDAPMLSSYIDVLNNNTRATPKYTI